VTPNTTKRLQYFEQVVAEGNTEPMALYGLAMEYRSLERHDESLAAFTRLRDTHPDYVAAYLMCGQLLEQMSRPADARGWYEAGIAAAKQKRDTHAQTELEGALTALG
jgi:tetratricopeptide (TPR) repeat protein